MITSLHASFIVIFGNVYFVIVILNIYGQKMWISVSSQNSIPEKSVFRQFEISFLNVELFPKAVVAFSC